MSFEFEKKRPRDKISSDEWNRLNMIVQGLVKSLGFNCFVDSTGVHIRRSLSGNIGDGLVFQRAKLQTSGINNPSNGKMQVKVLDSTDVETGDAFTVHAFPAESTWDMSEYVGLPQEATGKRKMLIYQGLNGKYYYAGSAHVSDAEVGGSTALFDALAALADEIRVVTDVEAGGSPTALTKDHIAAVKIFHRTAPPESGPANIMTSGEVEVGTGHAMSGVDHVMTTTKVWVFGSNGAGTIQSVSTTAC